MSNKLDDRYVAYDLTSAIGIIPVEQGGTGNNVMTPNMVVVSRTGGGTDYLRTSPSISEIELNTLNGINTTSTIQSRLISLEAHENDASIHVPDINIANAYLKSNSNISLPGSWQTGILPPTTGAVAGKILQAASTTAASWVTGYLLSTAIPNDNTKYLNGDGSWDDITSIQSGGFPDGGLGVWSTGAYGVNVTHTNNTGAAICVYITASTAGGTGNISLIMEGVTIYNDGLIDFNNINWSPLWVPDGATWRVSKDNAVTAVIRTYA